MSGTRMKRIHKIVFDDENMHYTIYRQVKGRDIILGQIGLRQLFNADYDQTIADVSQAIGEVVFTDSKTGIEEAWNVSKEGKE